MGSHLGADFDRQTRKNVAKAKLCDCRSANDLLLTLAAVIDNCERAGSEQDEPEGSRYIQLSDSMAAMISHACREMAGTPAKSSDVRGAIVELISIRLHAAERVIEEYNNPRGMCANEEMKKTYCAALKYIADQLNQSVP